MARFPLHITSIAFASFLLTQGENETCNHQGIMPAAYDLLDKPIQGTQAACISTCMAHADCVAFSWDETVPPTQEGECYLKTAWNASAKTWYAPWVTIQTNDCQVLACSITDGSNLSANYPCLCGDATCNINDVCTSSSDACQATCLDVSNWSSPWGATCDSVDCDSMVWYGIVHYYYYSGHDPSTACCRCGGGLQAPTPAPTDDSLVSATFVQHSSYLLLTSLPAFIGAYFMC